MATVYIDHQDAFKSRAMIGQKHGGSCQVIKWTNHRAFLKCSSESLTKTVQPLVGSSRPANLFGLRQQRPPCHVRI